MMILLVAWKQRVPVTGSGAAPSLRPVYASKRELHEASGRLPKGTHFGCDHARTSRRMPCFAARDLAQTAHIPDHLHRGVAAECMDTAEVEVDLQAPKNTKARILADAGPLRSELGGLAH